MPDNNNSTTEDLALRSASIMLRMLRSTAFAPQLSVFTVPAMIAHFTVSSVVIPGSFFFEAYRNYQQQQPPSDRQLTTLSKETRNYVMAFPKERSLKIQWVTLKQRLSNTRSKLSKGETSKVVKFKDSLSYKMPHIPVRLHGKVYDLMTLLHTSKEVLEEKIGKFKYTEIEPVDQEFFDMFDVVYEDILANHNLQQANNNTYVHGY